MQGEQLVASRVQDLLPSGSPWVAAVLSWSDPVIPDGKCGHTKRIIWGRMSLVPESAVRWAAERLTYLVSTRSLVLLTATGIICYVAFFTMMRLNVSADGTTTMIPPKNLPIILSGLVLFLLSGIWHELGHAAALSREGYAPGRIGLGFLLVIPVLFAEVTAVGILERRGRLRVDFSGMVFQLMAGGLLLSLSIAFQFWIPVTGVLQVAGFSSLMAVLWSLLPFVRSDGYWALADFLGVEDLDGLWSKSGTESRSAAWFMIVFRLANIGFLIFLGIVIPLRLFRWLRYLGWWPGQVSGWEGVLLQVSTYLVLAMIWLGLGRHGWRLGKTSWHDLRALREFQND